MKTVEEKPKCVVCGWRVPVKNRKACQPCWNLTGVENTREKYGLPKELPHLVQVKQRVAAFNNAVRMGKSREHIAAMMGHATGHVTATWRGKMKKAGYKIDPLPLSDFAAVKDITAALTAGKFPPRQVARLERLLEAAKQGANRRVSLSLEHPEILQAPMEWLGSNPCPEHGVLPGWTGKKKPDCAMCYIIVREARAAYTRAWREASKQRELALVAQRQS